MGREYKTVHKAYAAWECDKEIVALNKESEKGWQLIKGNVFSSKFKWNPEIRYRYQLDHQNKIEEMGRYIETYREQGWEYVNTTFNGWSYFRKLYDPSLPEEEYEIFSDASSKEEMHQSWIKAIIFMAVLVTIATVCNIVHLVQLPTLPNKWETIISMLAMAVLIMFVVLLKNPQTRQKMKLGYVFAFAILVSCGNIGEAKLLELRPIMNCSHIGDVAGPIPADKEHATEWLDFDVNYKDSYFMDLEIEADTPVTFTIVNDADETIYMVREANLEEENYRLELEKGNYRIYFMDFELGSLFVHMELE